MNLEIHRIFIPHSITEVVSGEEMGMPCVDHSGVIWANEIDLKNEFFNKF